ncbi:MAG: hypothetical protein DIZ80_00430 [endosymbiont of Galathealinum brachiosum]|uniref:Uncharacterized protein n=1 Tax=endosymbiont of Galathealinum brachiosum TaxID=2200906 RepID=A0A370DNM2_9GAMM|nr:MAG: hypothetical protein DIZ80_00430 [endosymbiont of Galathealinum brachiosum]
MLKQLIILISLISLGTSCTASEKVSSMTVKDVGSLHFIASTFKTDEHKLKFCGDYLCVIDGHLFFGSDGKKPAIITKRFYFKINGHDIDLNITGMFEPGVTSENISQRISVEHYWGDFYKVAGRFSDGAGSYIAQWIVSKDGSIRTHLSDMETALDIQGMINR